MKIICSKSGIEFDTSHIPGTFYGPELSHPIFYLPQKRLLAFTRKWAANELTQTDSYLLFLALLNSSERIDFRVPAFRTQNTDSIVANNMEFLVRTVFKINTVQHPAVVFPKFVISQDTRGLQNVFHWIEIWESSYQDFISGKMRDIEIRDLVKREEALQRMIKNPHRRISEYSGQIAEWAAVAGSFPTFNIKSPFTGLQISCAEYWKILIQRATKEEHLYSIPDNDLAELIDHCHEHISVGSIQSNALFKALNAAKTKVRTIMDFGDGDVRSSYKILTESDTVEGANMRALVDSAPLDIPKPEQYPNKFQYLRAKMRWDMANKFKKD